MILHLRVVRGKPAGKTLVFGPGNYLMGRGDECHVRFNSDWVSRQHCLMRVRDSEAVLSDLGSRNGTLINGRLCEPEQPLSHGDQLQIGPVTFEVVLQTAAQGTSGDTTMTLQPDSGEQPRPSRSAMDATAARPALDLDKTP